jgi:hypothetical protein
MYGTIQAFSMFGWYVAHLVPSTHSTYGINPHRIKDTANLYDIVEEL